MNNITRTIVLAAFVCLTYPATQSVYAQGTGEAWETLLGKPAPNVKLPMMGGETFDLASYKGKKVVVMDFWASWCPPCRLIIPTIAEVADSFKGKDVYFVAINQGEPSATVQRFVESTSLKMNIALDEQKTASRDYLVDSIPRLVVVGKDGSIQAIHAGLEGATVEEVKNNAKTRLKKEVNALMTGKNLVKPKAKTAPTEEPSITAKK